MLNQDNIFMNVDKKFADNSFFNKVVDVLYDEAVSDILDFTHLTLDEINDLPLTTVIGDLIAYRFNTLSKEGITSENIMGVATSYSQDIPPRIKRKLIPYRRLNYERK